MRIYYIYIVTNSWDTVLYTGVTNNLLRRVEEHKLKRNPFCFTARYNVNKLVYYEEFDYIQDAIDREKAIKAGSRKKKIHLIESINPDWKDLSEECNE